MKYPTEVISGDLDSFGFRDPIKKVLAYKLKNKLGDFEVQVGLEPGKIAHPKGIEDRAIATDKLFGVFDGVGEMWHPPVEERFSCILPNGSERTLGDIPGYFLSRRLLGYQYRADEGYAMPSLHEIVSEASRSYQEFLALNHYDLNAKEHFGGCTFALALLTSSGDLEIAAAGDALAMVLYKSPEIVTIEDGVPLPFACRSTPNQLPTINKLMQGKKEWYYAQYGEIQGRKLFNAEFKPIQRNEWANTRYAFFNGDPRCAARMTHFKVRANCVESILLLTDGCFDCTESSSYCLERQIWQTLSEKGIEGLLAYNQEKAKPEATAIVINRI